MKDLTKTHPHLAEQFDVDKNYPTTVDTITKGMSKKYWWRCPKGHSWSASPNFVGKCSVCCGRTVVSGVNDLLSQSPKLASEWDYEKNSPLTPAEVYVRGVKKVWWLCGSGHSYKASPLTRQTSGCGTCGNKRVQVGFNDLATTHPNISVEWDHEKNGDLLPTGVVAGSTKVVGWVCSKGHKWEAQVRSRLTTGCAVCANKKVVKGFNDLFTTDPDLKESWDWKRNEHLTGYEVTRSSGARAWWVCDKGHSWYGYIFNRIRHGCPTCNANTYSSNAEKDVQDFVESLGVYIERNYRGIKGVSEVDVFVPSKKLAIEYNGLYFHSDARKHDKDYHYKKYKKCKDQGIQLIQVWEDEWSLRQDVVKRMIAHKLGVTTNKKVPARKVKVVEVPYNTAKDFLDETHIQGSTTGSLYFGLEYESGLVGVAVFKKRTSETFELIRYSTSETVIGGLGKILSYLKNNTDIKKIVTFADHCVSNGNLYTTLGFNKDGVLAPDYKYKIGNIREHKFKYRKARFRKDPSLVFEEGKTESELAAINNLYRIWDAGKTRYVKSFSKTS